MIRGLGDEKKKKAKQLAELKKYVLRTEYCRMDCTTVNGVLRTPVRSRTCPLTSRLSQFHQMASRDTTLDSPHGYNQPSNYPRSKVKHNYGAWSQQKQKEPTVSQEIKETGGKLTKNPGSTKTPHQRPALFNTENGRSENKTSLLAPGSGQAGQATARLGLLGLGWGRIGVSPGMALNARRGWRDPECSEKQATPVRAGEWTDKVGGVRCAAKRRDSGTETREMGRDE